MSIKYTTSIDLLGNKITNVGVATLPGDLVTKEYVDGAIAGLEWKASVRAAADENGYDLDAAPSLVDGVTLQPGQRFLVQAGIDEDDQPDPTESGIYIYAGVGVRPELAEDTTSEGSVVRVDRGTAYYNNLFVYLPILPGINAWKKLELGSAGATPGIGLMSQTAGVLDVNLGAGLFVDDPNGSVSGSPGSINVNFDEVARRSSATIGDGNLTQFSWQIVGRARTASVQVVETSTGNTVLPDITRTDDDIVINFSTPPAQNEYTVVYVF